MHTCCGMCVEIWRHPVGSCSPSFLHVDTMGHTQVTGLCSKFLYLLSHIASPQFSLKPCHPFSTSGAEAKDLTCGAFAIRSLERCRETGWGCGSKNLGKTFSNTVPKQISPLEGITGTVHSFLSFSAVSRLVSGVLQRTVWSSGLCVIGSDVIAWGPWIRERQLSQTMSRAPGCPETLTWVIGCQCPWYFFLMVVGTHKSAGCPWYFLLMMVGTYKSPDCPDNSQGALTPQKPLTPAFGHVASLWSSGTYVSPLTWSQQAVIFSFPSYG